MNETLGQAGELLYASKDSVVFRSLLLPSRNISATTDFFLRFGFRKTLTKVENVPDGLPTVKNNWHTLIFYSAPETSHVWSDAPAASGIIPRFLYSGITTETSSKYSPTELSTTDPDGRIISLLHTDRFPREASVGLLCWVDSIEAFRHKFIRIDLSGSKLLATAFSFMKSSGSLQWPSGGLLPVYEQSELTLDAGEVAKLISFLCSHQSTGSIREKSNFLEDSTFYRFLIFDKSKADTEITAPLSQVEGCLSKLSKPMQKLLDAY